MDCSLKPKIPTWQAGGIPKTSSLKSQASSLLPVLPGVDDLLDGLGEADSDVPTWIVLTHLAEVAVVTDVIADSILVDIGILLRIAGERFSNLKGFQNGTTVAFAAANVVDLSATRCIDECGDE